MSYKKSILKNYVQYDGVHPLIILAKEQAGKIDC